MKCIIPSTLLFAVALLNFHESPLLAAAADVAMECHADGTCSNSDSSDTNECGLWMAESSIANAGWGIYTGKDLPIVHNVMGMADVVIPVADRKYHAQLLKQIYNISLPELLLDKYFWHADDTKSTFDADHIESAVPGFGMLANSHAGLVNLVNMACFDRIAGPRNDPSAGAASHYQDCQFHTTNNADPIPAGRELFVDYGVNWFERRSDLFGDDLPLSGDFQTADTLRGPWQHEVDNLEDANLRADLWNTAVEVAAPHLSQRSRRALPKSAAAAARRETAYDTVPNAIRSPEWLRQNGQCLDHIKVKQLPNERRTQERGAFARRTLAAGTVVAPAPVVHLSRQHLEMLLVDSTGTPATVLWQGHQLLLNYCYGHPSSSLLLFPYSPGVNLINHDSKEPNVALRWSDKGKVQQQQDWFKLRPVELLEQHREHAGLAMEFYALRDIAAGEEIRYDYGTHWQQAWEEHVATWSNEIVHADDYVSAHEYGKECNAENKEGSYDCMYELPSWIETLCYTEDTDAMEAQDEDGWYGWVPLPDTDETTGYHGQIHDAMPCTVDSVAADGTLLVSVQISRLISIAKAGLKVKNVPRSAILYSDLPYTTNQFLRQAFRHEIGLPDQMVPAAWRDLEPEPDTSCGLYMAESAIPNSGLGIYTAEAIPRGDLIFYGDVVIQVEDMDVNRKLRHWAAEDFDFDEPDWLLNNYYWHPEVSLAVFDAEDIQSIIPGLGMLANSHAGLVNAREKAPTRVADLHRGKDPGAGASTTYHDVHYRALMDIEPGTELFLHYGDSWFRDREDLGLIPLSGDFEDADRLVGELSHIVAGNKRGNKRSSTDLVLDALRVVTNLTSFSARLAAVIPKDYDGFEQAVKEGTASLTVPDQIRSMKWLKKNGRCLDNIKPGRSTIRQAGRGAFATRRIKKGDVIAPMPLVHVRRHHMEVYDADDYNDRTTVIYRSGTQLLLNYCYGHPESSLLLFPYSPVVNYVNHNSTGYNADLRWSNLPNHHSDWLKRSPDDLDSEDHAGLIMELVATRDIEAGEEIFLNYGSSWDSSWNSFVEEWDPTDEDQDYVSAAALNQRLEWLRTQFEQITDPYSFEDDVFTGYVHDLENGNKFTKENNKSVDWTGSKDMFNGPDYIFPCKVVARQSTTVDLKKMIDRKDSVKPIATRYTVLVNLEEEKSVRVDAVPRKAIRFFDRKYLSDDLIRDTFRHEIHIPDAMVPDAWRDLKQQ